MVVHLLTYIKELHGSTIEPTVKQHVYYPATVHVHRRLVPHRAELVLVVAEQLEREVVVAGVVVVPRDRVDAGVRKVLVRLFAQQPQKSHLDGADRVVSDLEAKSSIVLIAIENKLFQLFVFDSSFIISPNHSWPIVNLDDSELI